MTAKAHVERRGKGRLKLRLPVQAKLPSGEVLSYVTENLSDSGVFLCASSEQIPEIGTRMVIWLEALPFDPPEVDVEVVHVEARGFGVQFLLK